ncbi:MAG: DEAD/DEAH box helicase [Bacteroidetes bacterium]|nr:DEAD/DEAH box helicase [Bacteroidota bacterium]
MTLALENDRLVVYDKANSIDAVGRSQLSFWGFRHDPITNSFSAPLDSQLFFKVTKYFEKEELPFSLSAVAKSFYDAQETSRSNFEDLKRIAASYKDGKFDFDRFEAFNNFTVKSIFRPLKIHQLKAAYHLYLLGNGANFSVPGSGKTSVVLTVYEKLRLEGKVNTLFVIGPPSSFGPWKNEFAETLGRIPRHIVVAGGDKKVRHKHYSDVPENKAELYLTSFHSLMSDQKEVTSFLKMRHVKAFVVVDEGHYIKQIKGNWAQAIMKQAEKATYRCVLTGTPMPKSYTDIFNLFDFLWPNQNPISQHDKALIKHNEEKGNTHSVKHILDASIGPLFYRVRKVDLNLKGQNFIEPHVIEMKRHERFIYDSLFKRISDFSKTEYFKNIEFINSVGKGRIMRLRQSVSYPRLLNTAIENYDERLFKDMEDLRYRIRQYDSLETPAKISFLIKLVRQLHKRKLKVVIWSNFIETIKLIESNLKKNGFNCKKIYGSTPVEGTSLKDEETREKIRDEFVDPKSGLDILIANPAACAESISLHKTCHNAVYYDLSYNCAQYLQSLDRIHRVGGSEWIEANYHFLQYKNTIDADIRKNIDDKTRKMFDIIEEDYAIYSLNMFDSDGDVEAYERLFRKKATKPSKRK